MTKSTNCSCKGYKFGSQHLALEAHNCLQLWLQETQHSFDWGQLYSYTLPTHKHVCTYIITNKNKSQKDNKKIACDLGLRTKKKVTCKYRKKLEWLLLSPISYKNLMKSLIVSYIMAHPKILFLSPLKLHNSGMVMHTINGSIQEAEASGSPENYKT